MTLLLFKQLPKVHFTVVCLMTLLLSGSEAGGDLALIQTFLPFRLLIMLFSC